MEGSFNAFVVASSTSLIVMASSSLRGLSSTKCAQVTWAPSGRPSCFVASPNAVLRKKEWRRHCCVALTIFLSLTAAVACAAALRGLSRKLLLRTVASTGLDLCTQVLLLDVQITAHLLSDELCAASGRKVWRLWLASVLPDASAARRGTAVDVSSLHASMPKTDSCCVWSDFSKSHQAASTSRFAISPAPA